MIGNLNTIAPLVTMFFLLSYGVVNLACFALKLASAPNFRPTFNMYSRTTGKYLYVILCLCVSVYTFVCKGKNSSIHSKCIEMIVIVHYHVSEIIP